MVLKILHNNYSHKVLLKDIKLSKNKEFYIWTFEKKGTAESFLGFTASVAYYGSKTHMWYSLLMGYFLPEAYTINFSNLLNKDCVIIVDAKKVVRNIVPLTDSVMNTKQDTEIKTDEDIFN